ncbi:Zinc finger protein pegasus [Plakobranchus ocellatus]|uniref:Zinc finger protein pegasus n=1 Tax=Plakobranchus ocellatus TaxID=259542 RepID=A0AAV4B8K6_9GAST|nr:Zinc finger protein pegasus [Plakobranchus ocellatus]
MSEERDTPHEVSPLPDSISNLDSVESVNRCSPVVTAVPNSTQVPAAAENSLNVESQIDSPLLPDSSPGCHITDNVLKNNSNGGERTHPPIAPRELLLSASSTSAFRPFFTQASAQPTGLVCGSSTYTEAHPITSTPVSRRSERLATLPGASTFTSLQSFPQLSLPQDTSHAGESTVIVNSNVNDENDDGRTTASAPPCTPAPEPYQQPQSPFRNNRQIKKIDLLAMSRSRQSDRAENARRDGRLAPSPRKKDEVLRNSGFIFPAGRGFAHPPNMRLSMQQNSNPPLASNISPDRTANRSSSTASPNVDVVSVDDQQPDPSKCMFSIQFHDFSREQMMKCSLCGFVTNNSRFYRRHRRMHSRQYQPNLIHCNLCDYSTSQIRRMREHTMSHHPHPQPATNIRASGSSSQNQVSMLDAASHHLHQPQFQGHLMINGRETSTGANFILPVTGHQPINLGPSSAIAPPPRAPAAQPISATSTLGLPTYMPTPLDGVGPTATHHLPAAGLQHPPQGSALLRNYSAEEQQQQMANYMQSLLSNLITPAHTNPGNSATSTGLFMQVAGNRHAPSATQQNATLSTNRGQLPEDGYNFRRLWSNNVTATSGNNGNASMGHMTGPSGFFKVKTEPIHQNHNRHHDSRIAQDLPSSTQKEHLSRRDSCRQSDVLDSESGMDMSSDDPASSPQPPPLHRSRLDTHINRDNILSNSVTTSSCGGDACSLVQSSAVGGVSSQCAMPFIKIEFPPHRESCSLTHGGFSNNSSRNERSTTVLVDRETQCEIISASNLRGGVVSGSSRQIGGRTQSETVSSAGGGSSTGASGTPGSVIDTRCYFCGVTFDDDVLFSIHVGCHSHTDPFMCNVCGKQCHNKYGFYSHIMRGHQA